MKFINYLISFSFFLLLITSGGCKKDENGSLSTSSIKIIETVNEPKSAKLTGSTTGNLFTIVTSGDNVVPIKKQELFLLSSSGELLRTLNISDTIFQYMSALSCDDGGFFVCASTTGFNYVAIYKLNHNGDILWSKSIPLVSGTIINELSVAKSFDNNYMVLYQASGTGYFITKMDDLGNELLNKKVPPPGYIHQGPGLNYGEKYVRFFQPNDSMIVIQGITYDGYSEIVNNCFIRVLTETISQKWFSTNYDSLHFESGAGLLINSNNEISLILNKSKIETAEGFGDVVARSYSLNNTYMTEFSYPGIGSTPNLINKIISSPDGGYLMIGSSNQLPSNDLVSPNNILLMKVRADLSLDWYKIIKTYFPAKGKDVVYLKDGSIAILGLLKDNLSANKLMYVRLDSFGNLILN